MKEMTDVNANWVALMPYAYSQSGSAELTFNLGNRQWWGERVDGISACVDQAQQAGLQVMIKPHIWIGHGEYTGELSFSTENDWESWNADYKEYLLAYAELSESKGVEMLCIGTELSTHVTSQSEYWADLIASIRTVYSGKLTYAGNWDSYKNFPHWSLLDYIGVDAYFPVSAEKSPTADSCANGWKPWIKEIEALSKSENKKVIFTEYGYRSIMHCAERPWESSGIVEHSQTAQSNALQGLYSSVWNEDWLLGGFIWKWHDESHRNESRQKNRFTPQGKSAIDVVRRKYFQK